MSSRYALYSIDMLRDRFAPASGVPKGVKPHYNISPASLVPVIVSRDGVNHIEMMKWGFIPASAKDTNSIFRYKTFNARSEGIFDKPTWQTAIRTQRCLVPADGFYEWKTTSGAKNPFYIQPADRHLFAFAGVYGSWTDPAGTVWGMCSIITTNSATESDMMPSRLPVIVHPDDEADWLNPAIGDINSLYKIMRPYEHDQLTIMRVGDAVNSTKPNVPSLINRFERA
jgi:putative SOS response-associated peptidase YedK